MATVDATRVLTWLHISDLHFEPTMVFDRSSVLEALCKLVEQYRGEGRFVPDLVFVTGDIANRGADEEYKWAAVFFDALLGKLGLGRERLFVVPGNHDVDRTQGRFLKRSLKDEEESDDFFGSAKAALHLEKLRAFREWHQSYFSSSPVHDPFSLSAAPTTLDVRGMRVSVLPINTATFALDDSDHNKLWVGRSWLNGAVARLDAEADLRVALMHHPLDWLHDQERGQIKSELADHVDVVLRGHLHDNEAETFATATRQVIHLAAGATYQSPHWPRRALFAAADLDGATLRVHPVRFEKDSGRRWTHDTSVFATGDYEGNFPLQRVAARRPKTSPRPTAATEGEAAGHIGTHRRTWRVFGDGIAEVLVELADVRCDDGVTLALPEPPFCHVVADENATTSKSPVKVMRDDVASGHPRFRIRGSVHQDRCAWTYTISNALALHKHDADLLHAPAPHHGDLPRGISGRPHMVLCDYGRLELRYEFDGVTDVASMVESPHAIVEHLVDGHGHARWRRVADEEARCDVRVSDDGRAIVLGVERPRYRHRYTLAYTPRAAGLPPSIAAVNAAKEILDGCRARSRGADPIVAELTEALLTAMNSAGCGPLGERASATGFIWSGERRMLLPAFGRFMNQGWSARFQYGSGVAGHALRFAKIAAWIRGADRARSVIFQEKTDAASSYSYDYHWVVCVPLLVDVTGPAIGIVSFASPATEAAGDQWFEGVARDAAGDAAAIARVPAKTDLLVSHINAEFWAALRDSTHAASSLRNFADQVFTRLAASEGGRISSP